MLLPSRANRVRTQSFRAETVFADAKASIRLPQLTGALRSALFVEPFLVQDSLEEAIKVQKTIDPIPTWPYHGTA
jgi:hypothetical protein